MKDEQITDAILIDRFQNGDMEAMDALVKRHQNKAYRFACRLTNDQEQAADVVADAFIRMYRSTHSFKGQSSFTTWMFRIVTNCFLDMRKKSVRRPTLSLDVMMGKKDSFSDSCFETTDTNPHNMLESFERNQTLEQRIAQLPHFQKVMILLYHQEMLSYEQIAETLNMPIGTVKSRLNRARLRLRHALRKETHLFMPDTAYMA